MKSQTFAAFVPKRLSGAKDACQASDLPTAAMNIYEPDYLRLYKEFVGELRSI